MDPGRTAGPGCILPSLNGFVKLVGLHGEQASYFEYHPISRRSANEAGTLGGEQRDETEQTQCLIHRPDTERRIGVWRRLFPRNQRLGQGRRRIIVRQPRQPKLLGPEHALVSFAEQTVFAGFQRIQCSGLRYAQAALALRRRLRAGGSAAVRFSRAWPEEWRAGSWATCSLEGTATPAADTEDTAGAIPAVDIREAGTMGDEAASASWTSSSSASSAI